MERRLKLAKELLNPDDSVLIVTIDENEYLRLGLLLEQIVPQRSNPDGDCADQPGGAPAARANSRGRTSTSSSSFSVTAQPVRADDDAGDVERQEGGTSFGVGLRSRWRELDASRHGQALVLSGLRGSEDSADQSVGDRSTARVNRAGRPRALDGLVSVWPTKSRRHGDDLAASAPTFRQRLAGGYVTGRSSRSASTRPYGIYFLQSGRVGDIEPGEWPSSAGTRTDAVDRLECSTATRDADTRPCGRAVPQRTSVRAPTASSAAAGRAFPFPKSLYAVEDALRFFVGRQAARGGARLLRWVRHDGACRHAAQSAGRRAAPVDHGHEQRGIRRGGDASSRAKGIRPGDPEWEALGIFEHITRPRVTAAITGRTPDGEPIKGDYRFTDEFPMAEGFEENAAFLELRTRTRTTSSSDSPSTTSPRCSGCAPARRDRSRSAPTTPAARFRTPGRTDTASFSTTTDGAASSRPARRQRRTAFIVTDSPTAFAGIAAELPTGIDTVRLLRAVPVDVPARARSRLMRYELLDYQRDAATESSSASTAPAMTGARTTTGPRSRSRRSPDRARRSSPPPLSRRSSTAQPISAPSAIRRRRSCGSPMTRRSIARREHDARRIRAADQLAAARAGRVVPRRRPGAGHVYFLNIQKLSQPSRLRPGRHERPRVHASGTSCATRSGRRDRSRARAGRGASGHEAHGRPADDRAADHRRSVRLEPAGADRVGHLGHHRAVQRGHGRGHRSHQLPERRGRHRARAGIGHR